MVKFKTEASLAEDLVPWLQFPAPTWFLTTSVTPDPGALHSLGGSLSTRHAHVGPIHMYAGVYIKSFLKIYQAEAVAWS